MSRERNSVFRRTECNLQCRYDTVWRSSGDYVEALRGAGVRISMTQDNHCYENAKAERLNGILKQEYGLGACFGTKREALRAVSEAVNLYNCRRPHQSLGYATPMSVHVAA